MNNSYEITEKIIMLTGTVSELATGEIQNRGWKVSQQTVLQ